MDDELRRQRESRRDCGTARFDGRYLVAGGLQLRRTRGFEDGAAYAAAHCELGVRGVNDGVNVHASNVLTDNGERHFMAPICGDVQS